MQSNALALITPDEYQMTASMAQALHASGLLPKEINTPQKAVAIILAGRELGVAPWQALSSINVILGKPSISPQLMLALIQRSGQLEDLSYDSTDTYCKVTMKRRGQAPHVETFTKEDAIAQNLWNKDGWKKQPKVMLRWRAVAACCRILFSDIILGLYTPEEMGADVVVTEDGAMQVVSPSPEPPALPANVTSFPTPPTPPAEPGHDIETRPPLWTPAALWKEVQDVFKAEQHFQNALALYTDPLSDEYLTINEHFMPLADAAALIRLYRSRTGKAELRVFEDEAAREKFVGLCAGLVPDDRAIVTTLDSIADYPVGSLSAWKGDKHTAWAAMLGRSTLWQYEAIVWPANAPLVVKAIARFLCAEADGQAVADAQFDAVAMP